MYSRLIDDVVSEVYAVPIRPPQHLPTPSAISSARRFVISSLSLCTRVTFHTAINTYIAERQDMMEHEVKEWVRIGKDRTNHVM